MSSAERHHPLLGGEGTTAVFHRALPRATPSVAAPMSGRDAPKMPPSPEEVILRTRSSPQRSPLTSLITSILFSLPLQFREVLKGA